MDELIFSLIAFIEKVGVNNTLIVSGIIAIIIVPAAAYLSVVLESYSYASGSLLGAIRYGQYEVVVTEKNNSKERIYIVSAWNKTHAVEKVSKKQTQKMNFTYSVNKTT